MCEIIHGNILDSNKDIIVQQVNCHGVMGAGLARSIYIKWPIVKKSYIEFCERFKSPMELLGRYNMVRIYDHKFVCNIFGQLNFGRNKNVVYTNYGALDISFRNVSTIYNGMSFAFPYGFGCGLANGNWDIVYDLISTYFPDAVIYKLR